MRRAAEIVGCIILSIVNLLLWPIAKATEKLGEWLADDVDEDEDDDDHFGTYGGY